MMSTFHLLSTEFQADPYPFYARMREEGLSRIEPGGHLLVSRYADVAASFRNTAVFSSAGFTAAWEPPWLGPNPCVHSMHSMDPPEHTKMRGLVSTAFLPPVIERTSPVVQKLAESAAVSLAERGEADAVIDVALPVTAGTLGHFMNLDPSLHMKLKVWSDALFSITPVPKSPGHARHVRTCLDEWAACMRALIDERRAALGDDMISLLLRAEIDGQRLTEKDLVPFLVLLVSGGLETTANLIVKSMKMLAERPDIMDLLRSDLSLVPRFVDEMLRYDPPVHSLFRAVKSDTEIAGQKVPAGSRVLLVLGSAHRDERQFPNPDVFDVHRDPRGALVFGLGPHFCIGMGLAKLEGRLLIVRGMEKLPIRAVAA
jgi:cytochrome P450